MNTIQHIEGNSKVKIFLVMQQIKPIPLQFAVNTPQQRVKLSSLVGGYACSIVGI